MQLTAFLILGLSLYVLSSGQKSERDSENADCDSDDSTPPTKKVR